MRRFLFIDVVFWVARTGDPWRDLPERFGNWNSTWRWFDRWARKGVWQRVFEALQDPDLEWLILDSTVIPAHPCAAGAPKKSDGSGGQAEQALGRSRGGFGTKIHGAVTGLGLPARLILTPGQASDMTHAERLIGGLPAEVVIADKGVRQPGRGRGDPVARCGGGDPEPEEPGTDTRIRPGSLSCCLHDLAPFAQNPT